MLTSDERTMALADGRVLCFSEHGAPNGTPVFFFHGNGHCRLGRHPDDAIAQRLGIRLVCSDRPGLGGSGFQQGRRVIDWADDIAQLADHLEVERFAILAWSSGCPYALACASGLRRRISRVTLVSTLAPITTPAVTKGMQREALWMLQLARVSPALITGPVALMCRAAARDPEKLVSLLFARAPACDREILADPAVRGMFAAAYAEAARGGARGLAQEVSLIASDWEFDPTDISAPVTIYHGDADELTPIAMGRHFAYSVPNATLTVVSDAAHQFIWSQWQRMLESARGG